MKYYVLLFFGHLQIIQSRYFNALSVLGHRAYAIFETFDDVLKLSREKKHPTLYDKVCIHLPSNPTTPIKSRNEALPKQRAKSFTYIAIN